MLSSAANDSIPDVSVIAGLLALILDLPFLLVVEEVEKAEEKLGAPFGISWRARIPDVNNFNFPFRFVHF